MEITNPFTCSKCRKAFLLEEGGVCARCNKPFCHRHLQPKLEREKQGVMTWVCVECGKE